MQRLQNAYNEFTRANQVFRNASRAYHVASHHSRFIGNVAPFMSYAQEHQYIRNARNAHERMIRAWKSRNNAYRKFVGIARPKRNGSVKNILNEAIERLYASGGLEAVKLALRTTYRHKPKRVRSASPVRTRRSPSSQRTL